MQTIKASFFVSRGITSIFENISKIEVVSFESRSTLIPPFSLRLFLEVQFIRVNIQIENNNLVVRLFLITIKL